jgi:ribosomal-protein-alanine N-acetyltransferase
MKVLETSRLSLHEFELSDSTFLLEIMNQPDYHRYIGDRGVRTIADAETYIRERFISEYNRRGFGLWLVKLKDGMTPLGFAGIIVRDELDEPDVGYAIHEGFAGNGYAEEATRGILKYIAEFLDFPVICAITDPDNKASINVLIKCGFHFDRQAPVFGDGEDLNIYKLQPGITAPN